MTRELQQLREVHAIQGRDGCWDMDDYMLGLYNGLELALSIMENRAPIYKKRNKWVGLTDDDIVHIGVATGLERVAVNMIEAKLKEKNT